jgi:hypothetical protein
MDGELAKDSVIHILDWRCFSMVNPVFELIYCWHENAGFHSVLFVGRLWVLWIFQPGKSRIQTPENEDRHPYGYDA